MPEKRPWLDTSLLALADDSAQPSDWNTAVDPATVPAREGVNNELSGLEREVERLKTERDQIAFATRMELIDRIREYGESLGPYDQTIVIDIINRLEGA